MTIGEWAWQGTWAFDHDSTRHVITMRLGDDRTEGSVELFMPEAEWRSAIASWMEHLGRLARSQAI